MYKLRVTEISKPDLCLSPSAVIKSESMLVGILSYPVLCCFAFIWSEFHLPYPCLLSKRWSTHLFNMKKTAWSWHVIPWDQGNQSFSFSNFSPLLVTKFVTILWPVNKCVFPISTSMTLLHFIWTQEFGSELFYLAFLPQHIQLIGILLFVTALFEVFLI